MCIQSRYLDALFKAEVKPTEGGGALAPLVLICMKTILKRASLERELTLLRRQQPLHELALLQRQHAFKLILVLIGGFEIFGKEKR